MSKLLIVEDDQIVASIFRNKFTADGYAVEVVSEAEKGLERLHEFQPDAVLLDLALPRMNGVDFIRNLRSQEAYRTLPIVVFTNTYQSNLIQDARLAGATKCLAKANYTPKQVMEIVAELIASQCSSAPRPPAAAKANGESEEDLRGTFVRALPSALQEIHSLIKPVIKATTEESQADALRPLSRRIRGLGAHAGLCGLVLLARVCEAIEILAKELIEKPKSINASTLRSIMSAVDFLGILSQAGLQPEDQQMAPGKVLVVDDELISRRAVIHALDKARLLSVNVGDPAMAYALLETNHFDLIILDVDMPSMNGFELCAKLRKLTGHSRTPVVFVTNLNDIENRAHSTISGGDDFIGKPFLFIELALKALIHVIKSRLG